MKILLIGEYSRFHNSLKEGLTALGHQVTLIGTGDDFKKFPVDIDITPKWTTKNKYITKIRSAIYRISKIDISTIESGYRFKKQLPQLINYDVVQLINSWSIRATISKEIAFIKYLKKHNKRIFLSACGTDTYWIDDLLTNKLPYHILTPYLNNKSLKTNSKSFKQNYSAPLRYITPQHRKLFDFVSSQVDKIIPTDMDYYLSLLKNKKATTLIPTPINTSKRTHIVTPIKNKVVIFHGINSFSYYKKGNDIFEEALHIVKKKYRDHIKVITVESVPYKQYIEAYNSAHILLDQLYSHDQGYNALEAMAKGKVVFTGAGDYFTEHYNLKKTVAINATPDPVDIANKLEYLIENKNEIITISKNAREFVEQEHHYIKIAQKYLDIWKKA